MKTDVDTELNTNLNGYWKGVVVDRGGSTAIDVWLNFAGENITGRFEAADENVIPSTGELTAYLNGDRITGNSEGVAFEGSLFSGSSPLVISGVLRDTDNANVIGSGTVFRTEEGPRVEPFSYGGRIIRPGS